MFYFSQLFRKAFTKILFLNESPQLYSPHFVAASARAFAFKFYKLVSLRISYKIFFLFIHELLARRKEEI